MAIQAAKSEHCSSNLILEIIVAPQISLAM